MNEEVMKALVEMKDMLKVENKRLEQQLQAYKDKCSDLETDYAKSVENEKTLRYTVNKYYDENKAYKDKEDKLREYCNEQGKDMTKLESIFTGEETKEYVLLNGFLQILNEGDK